MNVRNVKCQLLGGRYPLVGKSKRVGVSDVVKRSVIRLSKASKEEGDDNTLCNI